MKRESGLISEVVVSRSQPIEYNQSLKLETTESNYIDFEIRIKDSGVGISKENISKLFMNFSKLDEHADMNHKGTGLGLSICKSLIELMGGSVNVESEINEGTTFIVALKTKCNFVPID